MDSNKVVEYPKCGRSMMGQILDMIPEEITLDNEGDDRFEASVSVVNDDNMLLMVSIKSDPHIVRHERTWMVPGSAEVRSINAWVSEFSLSDENGEDIELKQSKQDQICMIILDRLSF